MKVFVKINILFVVILTFFSFGIFSWVYAQGKMDDSSSTPQRDCLYKGSLILGYNDGERLITPLSLVGKGKDEALWSQYEPSDLVDVDLKHMTPLYREEMGKKSITEKMSRQAYINIERLLSDARQAGIDIFIHSAYRSYEVQCYVFSKKVYGQVHKHDIYFWEALKNVNDRSARPGQSEHQLGTVVDLVTFLPKFELPDKPKNSGYALEYEMYDTVAYQWLDQNAHLYGFVLSYPYFENSTDHSVPHPKTGYIFEPWHWRYIGVDYAKKFKACSGRVVLKEFLKNLSTDSQFSCVPE